MQHPLIRLGAFFAIVGFASSAAYWYTNFRIFSFLDGWQPGIGIGTGVLGVILVIAGVLIERTKKSKTADGPGSFGAPPHSAPQGHQQPGTYGQPGQAAGGQSFGTQGQPGPAGQRGPHQPPRPSQPAPPGPQGQPGQPGAPGDGPIQGPGFGPR